jgi:flagellar motor switch protein FliN/FliY
MSSASETLSATKNAPGAASGAGAAEVVARMPEFAELTPAVAAAAGSINHLLDVTVTVTAELGRVTLAIGDILKLGLGSVLQLDRTVADPVDLMVQGVRLARGEVVVVDDRFAIRIKEIADTKKRLDK